MSHCDFKHDDRTGAWLAWCPFRNCWAVAESDRGFVCAGCGVDLAERFSPDERDRKAAA